MQDFRLNSTSTIAKSNWKLLLLFLFSGLSVLFSPLAIITLLIFPFLFFYKSKLAYNLLLFVFLFMVNVLIIISGLAFISIFDIKISLESMSLLLIVLNSLVYIFRLKLEKTINAIFGKLGNKRQDSLLLLLVLGLSTIVSLAHFYPASSATAPITHDPEAHAYYAKVILQTGGADYFYAPGLHILTLIVSTAFSISLALSVHYITYFSLFLTAVSLSFFIYTSTRSRVFSVLALSFYLCSYIPWMFPVQAGKNALIMAGAFLPFVIYLFFISLYKKSSILFYLYLISLFGLGLIHYPVFAYGLAIPIVYLTIRELFRFIEFRKFRYKDLARFSAGSLLVLLMLFTWIKTHQSDYTNLVVVDRYGNVSGTEGITKFNLNPDIGSQLVRSINEVTDAYINQLTSHSPLFFYAFVLSVLIILISTYKKNYIRFNMLSISIILTFLMVPIIIRFLGSKSLDTTADSGILMVSIGAAYIVGNAGHIFFETLKQKTDRNKIRLLSLIGLIILLIPISYATVKRNAVQSRLHKSSAGINKHDIEAYTWINNNTKARQGFIVDAYANPKRPNVILSKKGGIWLPVYTHAESSMPFEFQKFVSKDANDNFKLYSVLKKKEVNSDSAIIALQDKGYDYYYQNKSSAKHETLDMGFIDSLDSVSATRVFENSNVVIYKIDRE